jgi:hypothetical protein
MILYLCMVLGVTIFALYRFNYEKAKQGFTYGSFVRDNWSYIALNLIVGLVVIICKNDPDMKLPEDFIISGPFDAVKLGFMGGAFFKVLIDSINPNKKTAIGINKETENK